MGKLITYHPRLMAPRAVTLQTDGTLGVDTAKLIITVAVTFGVDLVRAIKTGNIGSILSTLLSLISYGNLIALAEQAWDEIKDTSLEESNELNQHFADVLDLENDETERLIEFAVSVVPRVYGIALDGIGIYSGIRTLIAEVREEFSGDEETPEEQLPPAKANIQKMLAA